MVRAKHQVTFQRPGSADETKNAKSKFSSEITDLDQADRNEITDSSDPSASARSFRGLSMDLLRNEYI